LPFYDKSTEVGSEVVDEIEYYLLADASERSLLVPLATKLKAISPIFNSTLHEEKSRGKRFFFSVFFMKQA